jgi:hypothetical protein
VGRAAKRGPRRPGATGLVAESKIEGPVEAFRDFPKNVRAAARVNRNVSRIIGHVQIRILVENDVERVVQPVRDCQAESALT